MGLFSAPDDPRTTEFEREAWRMKTFAAKWIDLHQLIRVRDVEIVADEDAEWTTLGSHWRARAILGWMLSLAIFVGWFLVLVLLLFHSERRYDGYYMGSVLWGAAGLSVYCRAWVRNRRRSLRPSPFLFWFSGR